MPHFTSQQASRHQASLNRELGDTITQALADPDITEVMLNPDGELWLDSRKQGLIPSGTTMSPSQAQGLVTTIAGILGRVLTEEDPRLEAELPLDGSRLCALLPPITPAPTFAIRKRATELLPLSHYEATHTLTPPHAEILRRSLKARQNILISGGPGSGKTTFANALIDEMTQLAETGERLFLLEDTAELQCQAPNHIPLHTTPDVTLRDLVRSTLRMRPDRIVIGEVRGAEAFDLLKAWNTGNPGGLATLHANSALDALERLDHLTQEAGVPSQARLIASTLDIVVHMRRHAQRREVQELYLIQGYDPETGYHVEPVHPN